MNDLAPYLLTALIETPKRIIYVSLGIHVGARLDIMDLVHQTTDYSSSKLQLVLLTKALARLNSDIVVTAVDPGWVPIKMGGRMATDDLTEDYMTQVWLATLEDKSVSGDYFHHKKLSRYDQRADDEHLQNAYLQELASITKVKI